MPLPARLTRSVTLAALLTAIVISPLAASQAPEPQAIKSGFGKRAYPPGPDVTPPILCQHVLPVPTYTLDALRAGVEGTVELDVIVDRDGKVADTRVTKSLDARFGLDAAVRRAVQRWRFFSPAEVRGERVDVLVTVIAVFSLPPGASRFTKDQPLPRATTKLRGVTLDKVSLDKPPDPWRDPSIERLPRATKAGVTSPVTIRAIDPTYSSEAMRHQIQGRVELEAVVRADGSVGEVRVVKSLDAFYGLDDQAVKAARRWTFKPATIAGEPVDTIVVLEMTFRLH
jgi:TonB family protein